MKPEKKIKGILSELSGEKKLKTARVYRRIWRLTAFQW